MKRLILPAAIVLMCAGTVSADYVLLRININQLNIIPNMGGGQSGGPGGPGVGGPGGPGIGPGGPGVGGPGGPGIGPGGPGVGGPGGPGIGPGGPGVGGPGGPGIGPGGPGVGGPGGPGVGPGGPGVGPGGPGGPGFGPGGPGFGPGGPGVGPGGPGIGPGGPGVGPGGKPGGNQDGATTDSEAKWISVIVELKNPLQAPADLGKFGKLFTIDHKWGNKIWIPASPLFPIETKRYEHPSFAKEFQSRLAKARGDKKKSIENYLGVAEWALSRGQLKEFHRVMDEAEKVDARHPIMVNYLRVKKGLMAPLKDEDPAQLELIASLRSQSYKPYENARGHFRIYAQVGDKDTITRATVERRLAMMEDSLETFYYWFAMQGTTSQPKLPKYRLNSMLAASGEDFESRHMTWGRLPMVADGFTPRRDNFVVMSSRPHLQDPRYREFDSILNSKLDDARRKLQQDFKISVSREDLLSGKVYEIKGAGQAAVFIGAAQAAVLVSKVLEDDVERQTVTHETTRQLLIASEMFPRNVQIPDWMVEGLAALFETPSGSVYPTFGAANWSHFISFKHFQMNKDEKVYQSYRFAVPSEVLYNVVTDKYFRDARLKAKDAKDSPANEELQRSAKESWEVARASSWALVYYLSKTGRVQYLFDYGRALDRLPRDMDLGDAVLQACISKAFSEVADARNPKRLDDIKLKNFASAWFKKMEEVNLENSIVQGDYEKKRASEKPREPKTSTTANSGGTTPGGFPGGPGGFPGGFPGGPGGFPGGPGVGPGGFPGGPGVGPGGPGVGPGGPGVGPGGPGVGPGGPGVGPGGPGVGPGGPGVGPGGPGVGPGGPGVGPGGPGVGPGGPGVGPGGPGVGPGGPGIGIGGPGGGATNTPPGWTEFTSTNGRYKTAFPGKPKEDTTVASGMKFFINAYDDNAKRCAYLVSYSDLPQGATYDLDRGLDGAAAKLGKITSSSKITFGTYQGREGVIEGDKTKVKIRMYVAGTRLYQVMVIWDATRAAPNSEIETFLSAFRITEGGFGGAPGPGGGFPGPGGPGVGPGGPGGVGPGGVGPGGPGVGPGGPGGVGPGGPGGVGPGGPGVGPGGPGGRP